MWQMFLKKNSEYNRIDDIDSYYPLGTGSIVHSLNEKFVRYKNQLTSPQQNRFDTLIDLAIVTVMAMIMESRWGGQGESPSP